MEPVDMQYGNVVTDQIVYHLPPDMAPEGAPQDAKFSWPQHAVFVAKTVPAPGQVTVARSLARAFTFAGPDEYQDLRTSSRRSPPPINSNSSSPHRPQ